MSDKYLDYNISNVRKGDSKLRIKKNGIGDYLVATVVDGVEGYNFVIDPKDMPDIIEAIGDDKSTMAIIKEIAELPVTLTLVEG